MSLSPPTFREYIDIDNSFALSMFSDIFTRCFNKCYSPDKNPVILLCIGTDRSTGDCLGPLVGYKLSTLFKNINIHIYGTLDEPVHAKNLRQVIMEIKTSYSNPFIIAIDASLGSLERVGHITVGEGPLKPGAGVNKNLPRVGDMHITGIVNFGGFMEYLILQNTRLSLVMKMANIISFGIGYSLLHEVETLKLTRKRLDATP